MSIENIDKDLYQLALDIIGAMVLILDSQGKILKMNEAAERFTGFQTSDVQNQPYFWERFIPEEERKMVHDMFEGIHERMIPHEFENHWISQNGEKRFFHWTNTIIEHPDSGLKYLMTIGMDVTEQHQMASALRRSHKFHALLSHANEAIAKAREEKNLLQEICELAIKHTNLGMAWIGRTNDEGWFQILAAAGVIGYLEGIHISDRTDLPEGNGPAGQAWRTRQPVFIDFYESSPITVPWQERAKRFGLRSCATLPIIRGDQPWALLIVYHKEEGIYDDELQGILIDLAQDIGFGLDRLDIEKQERQASHFNNVLLNRMDAGVNVTRYPERVIEQINPKMWKMFGAASKEELEGQEGRKFYADEMTFQRVGEFAKTVLKDGEGILRDIPYLHMDGTTIYIDLSAQRLDLGDGVERIIWTNVDVTERHHHEQQIRELSEQKSLLLDNTIAGIHMVRYPERVIVEANPQFAEMMGYDDPKAIIGKPTEMVYPNDDENQRMAQLSNLVLAQGSGFMRDLIVRTRSGTLEYLDIAGKRLDTGVEPQPPHILWTSVNVTERQHHLDRMRHEMELASHLQGAFLPQHLPVKKGIDVAWEYIPSDFLAGDMINVTMIDDSHMAFYLLDVMGHGISAALNAFAINYFIRSSGNADEVVYALQPGELLTRLNAKFSDFYLTESYFTIFYGVVDLSTNDLTYAKGGHPSPLLLHEDGVVASLDQGDMPLGILADTKYQAYQVMLQPGDKLLLYSDGLTEMMNDHNEMFSVERVKNLMIQHKDVNIHQLLKVVLEQLRFYSGRDSWNDDVTLIGLEMGDN